MGVFGGFNRAAHKRDRKAAHRCVSSCKDTSLGTDAMRLIKALLFTVLFVSVMAGCGQRTKWAQKTTIYFATPNGPVVASQVMRIKYKNTWISDILGGGQFWDVEGEALIAKLGEHYVFVTLFSLKRDIFVDSYNAAYDDGLRYPQTIKKIKRHWDPLDVPRRSWPAFVVFNDLGDPDSGQRFSADELSARFGEGYSVERITIEATRDPVTKGSVKTVLSFSDAVFGVLGYIK